MNGLETYKLAGLVLALITGIGVVLRWIDLFVEDTDKEGLKRRFVDFWLSVAELSTTDSVGKAIRSRYGYMKHNIRLFMGLYWLLLLIMFIIVCVENYEMNAEDMHNEFAQTVSVDFSFLANTRYLEAAQDIKLFCLHRPGDCEKYGDELAWRKDVSRIATLESRYNNLLSGLSQNPFWLRLAADASSALVIILMAIPLSLSLLVSFNLTLWMLSKITSSSFKLIVILCLDVFIAVVAPVVLLNIFLLIGSFVSIIVVGGLIDFTYFDTVSMTTLAIAQSAMVINLSLLLLVGPAWLVYAIPDWGVRAIYLTIQMLLLRGVIYTTVTNFMGDTWKVAHFDFSPTYIDGVINFAIVTDLLYSLLFFLPGLGMILLQRWPFGQRTFLNIIQWFPEHPKGPIFAMSKMFLGFASEVRKWWRGE